MAPTPEIWIILLLWIVWIIMDRVPEASFGPVKTMVWTLSGRKRIIKIRQHVRAGPNLLES